MNDMDQKATEEEEEPKELTDEEFREWQKEETRREKKVGRIVSAIIDLFHFFF
jgi:hypothetical protein